MASICDGATCLGLSTDLNGSICLTNQVQCKDGHLTVPSQGSVLRRYASNGGADYTDGSAVDLTPSALTTNSGPRDVGGVDKLLVVVTNPFCSIANVLINFEFSAGVRMANTDNYSVSGEVSLSGTTFIEDNVTPFNTGNPQSAGPSTYGPITAYGQTGLSVADSGEVFDYTHAGSFTVMARLNSLASCTFAGHARVDATPQGTLRQIRDYNVAVTFLITPAL